MKVYSAVIERCSRTGLFAGFVPGFPGAHSQGETLDEINHNLHDVIAMLLEDGEPILESEFVGVQNVVTVLARGDEIAVRLPPQQEAELLDALDEADREEGISADDLFARLRRFG